MKVILTDYVYMHGVAGDMVEVADGFARNFLIPRKKAVKATPQAIARNQSLMAEAAMRRKELNDQLVSVAKQIDGVELVFGRRAERNNKLYGSVTTSDIAEALLAKTGIDINRRRISERPMRELGSFDVPVRMGQDLAPVLKVTIVREEEMAEYLRKREAEKNKPATEEVVAEETAEVEEVGAEE
jgi:large subunit ribosomal protein L9